MIIRVILIVAVLYILFSAYKKFLNTTPKKRKGLLIGYAVYGTIGLLLLAFMTGKLHWLGAVAAGAVGMMRVGIPALMRLAPFAKFLGKNTPFGNPAFNTEYLSLRLNLSSGQLSGEVIAGPHSGKNLSDLDSEAYQELDAFYSEKDKRSLYLLRVYKQKSGSNGHSQTNQSDTQEFSSSVGGLSLSEARQILGIDENASKKEIEKAYKRLIQKLHPDRGGNDYLASRVNLARDIVLEHTQP